MPIYEYECRKCGHRFERIQKFSDRKVRTCPECKGRVERLVAAPAIQFKGSGWYVTDYSDKGKPTDKSASEGDRKKAKGEGDAKKSSSKNGGSESSSKSDSGSSSKAD